MLEPLQGQQERGYFPVEAARCSPTITPLAEFKMNSLTGSPGEQEEGGPRPRRKGRGWRVLGADPGRCHVFQRRKETSEEA